MNKRNYQKELDVLLETIKADSSEEKPSLFLHCCCAPCSSYVLEYLHEYFKITLFFYNPNITEEKEYRKRKEELKRFVSESSFGNGIHWIDADYDPERFLEISKGMEHEPERGARCKKCFRLRLFETAGEAQKRNYDYFCTTLSISPHKNADLLMHVGEEAAERYGISYLPSDFKKKNGYKRSIELSRQYHLYRQDYCGCVFSREQRRKEQCDEKGNH